MHWFECIPLNCNQHIYLDRERQLQERQDAHEKFDNTLLSVTDWLEKMENKVDRLPSISIDPDAIQQQMDACEVCEMIWCIVWGDEEVQSQTFIIFYETKHH